MPSNVITTAILIITGVTAATILLTGVIYPALFGINDTVTTLADRVSDKALMDITPVFTYVTGGYDIHILMKNTGNADIPLESLKQSEVYIISRDPDKLSNDHSKTAFIRAPHKEMGGRDCWEYSFPDEKNKNYWKGGETVNIDVSLARPLETGEYTVRFVMFNGYTIDDIISIQGRRR